MAGDPELPTAELRDVFGAAFDGEVVADAIAEPVPAATLGIWRVRAAGDTAVLKLVGHAVGRNPKWQSGEAPDHWYYWKREPLAYESGLLSALRSQLDAPACRGVFSRADGTIALWLEDVVATPATRWTLDRYETAGRHLGHLYAVHANEPWLSRDWLRAYLVLRRSTTDISMVHEMLDALDRMPRSFCHFDLHPSNLFGDVDGPTIAIDWSFVGTGAIGEDAGNLVADAVLDFHIAPNQVDELYERVANGYATGLAEVGWRGPESMPRAAMATLIAAKYAWIRPELERAVAEQRELLNRRPLAEALQWWEPAVAFIEARVAEARVLLSR